MTLQPDLFSIGAAPTAGCHFFSPCAHETLAIGLRPPSG